MTYQRFSGVRVSVPVISVIASDPLDHADEATEDRVEHGDVHAHHEADREDEHGQVAHLVARRPRDLLQLGPDLIEVSADASHSWLLLSSREVVAGAIGLEPTTAGFGDRCSAN